ncbi:hypothetical protein ACOSP6_08650 [Tenacibaculum sp. MEBiC06402]|uniref:hypothetical protein n=1 Tax=unclassified Tenacibaculum TaxID=2635139 RepID=UPI003B99F71C
MKKSILNLGKALEKREQQTINGGRYYCPNGERALVGCINGTLIGYCGGGTTVNFGPCF